jgi:hypothetical protein
MALILPAAFFAFAIFVVTGATNSVSDEQLRPLVKKIVGVVFLGMILLPVATLLFVWLAPFVLMVTFIYVFFRWFFRAG